MIDLYDGELLDMLPSPMAGEIEHKCVSYALKMGIRRVIDYVQMTRTQSMIDELPEAILDVLAVELRTPYYLETMTIEQKRAIIEKTLTWHYTAGTPAALTEMISVVFGEGTLIEWPDYTEEPYTPGTFDIITDTVMTEDIIEQFLQIIERVKNVRSHIRRILISREEGIHESVGMAGTAEPEIPVMNDRTAEFSDTMEEYAGTVSSSEPQETITNNAEYLQSVAHSIYAAAAGSSAPDITILNQSESEIDTGVSPRQGTSAFADLSIAII